MSARPSLLHAIGLSALLASAVAGAVWTGARPGDPRPDLSAPPAAAAAEPASLPVEGAIPVRRFGPGPLHKVWIGIDETQARARLDASGGIVRSYDYGRFQVFVVDEGAFGGAEGLRAEGFRVRDELDLVAFNGFVLDGQDPRATLEALEPTERMTDPDSLAIDVVAGLYVIQYEAPVRDEWREELDAIGVTFAQPVPMNAYVVRVANGRIGDLQALAARAPYVQYLGAYEPAFRVHEDLRRMVLEGENEPQSVTIQLVNESGLRRTLAEIEAIAESVEGTFSVGPYVNVAAVVHPVFFQTLATDPNVFQIERRGTPVKRDERQDQIMAGNTSGNGPSAPGYLSWLAGKGFNSSQFGGFSVNVVDDSTGLTGHADLPNGRVDFTLNPTSQTGAQQGHGFLNAHIVAGFNDSTGTAFEDTGGYQYGLGVAPWAHVGSTAIFGPGGLDPQTYESQAYGSGARISTNSWSFIDGSQNPIPDYDAFSQVYDFITRDAQTGTGGNQEYFILFSAGNDGTASNSVSTPSTAKNILTVGAAENNRQTGTDGCGVPNSGANSFNDLASFSSQGPVDSAGGDGRWKPELVAPGTHIQAGVPQSNYSGGGICNQYWPSGQTLYGWSSGTSHSTPAVAGAAALVYQDFLNDSMAAPSPAMMKAVLVNSGRYMTGSLTNDTLPSNAQGMGNADLGRMFDSAARLYEDQGVTFGTTGQSHAVAGTVTDAGLPFRVTLVWTDAFGPTSGAPYVNDLDLSVTVGGTTYRGNVFSGASSVSGGTADFRNNTESVFLPAGTTGAFTVTVDASSISGDGIPGNGDTTDQDFALVIYNGSAGTGPAASFFGIPTSGNAPLLVNFTDSSSGGPTAWSWTFGDGGTSTSQNPSHNYTTPGTYSVTLDITAPGGNDSTTRTNYIVVNTPPAPGISDGSFESQTAGTAPTTPWSIAFGSGHVVNPAGGTTSDSGMPTDGTNWAEISATSTNGATPPSNPGGVTIPASGGAGISTTFSYAAGQTILEFDAAFLRNEDANSQYNDWMSVDVSDGSTWYNVYYADTFTATSGTSSKYGYAITPVSNVSIDLASIFPSSTTSTSFTLTALVGNDEDDFQPSLGYADDFRLTGSGPVPPTAEFTGTPVFGLAPLLVNFTDASTGDVTSWAWTFGDGGTSTAQNPGHTYTVAGTYTVSLTATGPAGSDVRTRTNYVTASVPLPTADFSGTPTSGAAPLSVDFTDLSTGSVTSWSWTFGDGGTSTLQNPTHIYTTPGTYTVILSATGPGGTDPELKINYISVAEPPPVADFTGTPLTGEIPLLVSFTDSSTGGPITSYAWTFGDGGTSTLQHPSHTYTAAGTYTVALTVTGPGGVDTLTRTNYVTANEPPPVADFTGTPLTGEIPLLVAFTDSSTGGPITSYAWTFGDGGTSTLQHPSHTYTAAGTYTVALTVTGPGGVDTLTRTNYVTANEPPPVADFTGTPLTGEIPLLVSFTDSSTGGPITSYAWTFGDGGTSTLQHPSHTYTAAGTYTVALTVTGPGGVDTLTRTNYVTANEPAPVADFTGTPLTGEIPLLVAFTDSSTGGPITSYAWTFGDGGTSTLQHPSHTYTAAGTYTVALTVTGPGGVDTLTRTNYVTANEPAPVADFTGAPLTGDIPLLVAFTDSSTGGPITSYAWTFGDGGTSTLQHPSHTYTAAGTYTVALTVTGPGGVDTLTRTNYVTANEPAPVADFTGTPLTGEIPLLVAFTDSSTGGPITSYAWTFGDGGTSTLQHPSHTYTAAGTYTVALTVTGPGGVDTLTRTNYVTANEPAPVADFTGTPLSGDIPLLVAFSDASTGGPITSYAWTFGDGGTSTLQHPSHTYTVAGTYTVALTVTGPGGVDTLTRTNYVTANEPAPVADFTGAPLTGDIPLLVAFTDSSTGGPITSYAWTFGDGGTSTLQHPSHTYTAAGTYTVALTVTGPGGVDTLTRTNYVTANEPAPVANFTGAPLTGDIPLLVAFTDSSTGGPITSYAWTFGDGGTSTLQHPSHTYTAAGTYTVALTVTGPGGVDTLTRTNYVTANEPAPVADFTGTPLTGEIPLLVAFTDSSTGGPITSYAWTFGDGGTSTLQHPSHTYTAAGTYTVALTVTGPGGVDTLTRTNYVTANEPAPVADFTGAPLTGDIPLLVAFTDSSTGGPITSYAWTFGDGGTSTLQHPSHTYTAAGTYTVALTVTGPGGVDTLTRTNYVTASEPAPVASFTGTPTSGTTPLLVDFTDGSTGAITSYAWTFGDGGTSTAPSPSHTYTVAGTYTVSLTVTGPGGADTQTRIDYVVVVEPAPVASFGAIPTSGTIPLAVDFTDSSTGGPITSWSWDFGDGGTSTQQDPSHIYTVAGTYTVSLTVTGPGGSDNATQVDLVTAVEPPPVAAFSGSPTSGSVPFTMFFTDASTGAITSWSWDFGDGGTSTQASPTHTYTSTGTFTVSLTVTGPGGGDTATLVGYVTVDFPTAAGGRYYVTFDSSSSVPGLSEAAPEDIVVFDSGTTGWAFLLDGSDVGLSGADVDAFHVRGDGAVLMSFADPVVIAGLLGGPDGDLVDDSDVVLFTPASLGTSTSGTFSFHLDGSDVGLTADDDDVSGLHELADGSLLISVRGGATTSGMDVVRFTGAYGAATSGALEAFIEASAFDLAGDNRLDGISFESPGSNRRPARDVLDQPTSLGGGRLVFSTARAFSSAADEDLSQLTGTFGLAGSGSIAPVLDLSSLGIPDAEDVNGLHFTR